MRIIGNYDAIELQSKMERKVFTRVFFEDIDIKERFKNKKNYYNFVSGKEWTNYQANIKIKRLGKEIIHMSDDDDKLRLMKVKNLIQRKLRKDKLRKI